MNTFKGARLKWTEVFEDPNLTLDSLKARAVSQHSNLGADGIRSVCWKVYLSCLPSLEISTWPFAVGTVRERYENLRRKYIRPIGSGDGPEPDLEVNNPLSLAEDSPWQQFFMDSELRKIIKQDVERTLPDNDYFRSEKVQEQLNDILFIYCKINHDVSYRQGMHELVAHILWVVSSESLDADAEPSNTSDNALDVMKSVLDSRYIEHDTFALFSSLMSRAKPWYEFSDEAASNRRAKPSTNNHTQLFGRPEAPEPPPGKQTPVIEWSMKIFHYLERIDNELFLHLKSHDIQPQLFGIRWFRLLFGREFPMEDALILWDGIFAKDPSLDICIFIGLAMLLRIRDDLLEQDFAGCLHKLMRYPSVKDVQLFIPQALSLQKLPNAAGGYEIIRQNSAFSGKPLPPLPTEAPETEHSRQNQTQQQHRPRVASPSPYSRSSSYHAPQNQHSSQAPGNGVLHLPPAAYDAIKPVAEGFASVTKNVLESKGGAALNKAIHDMKKNTQSYIRKANTQTSSPPDTGFPPNIEQTISSTNRGTTSHHPAPPQQTNQSSHASNTNSGKELQLQLGQIVAKALAILDTEFLSTPTGEDPNKANQEGPKKPTQSALAAMSGLEHVRDILLGFSKDFNPLVIESRMVGTPANTDDDASSGDAIQGVVATPVPPPKPSQGVQSVAPTSGVQQRKPVHAAATSTVSVTRSNSSGQVRAGSTARSSPDTLERRGLSRTSSHSSGVLGQYDQGYRSTSPTPAAQVARPQSQTPTPPPPAPAPALAPAPAPAPAPKPFSFDDLIDDTPAASARSASPSLSASRGAGVSGQPARAKSPRSSLTNSQFSWILNQDLNKAATGSGGVVRHTADGIPSSTSRTKVDPLASSNSRPKAGSLVAGHGLLDQAQEDDPLRS